MLQTGNLGGMARKAAPDSEATRALNDIIGIVLMGLALLLLVALISYHPFDSPEVATPSNHPVRNWIGPFGAWMAHQWLVWVGIPAFFLPFILLFLGLGCFFDALAYVRRRWVWTVVLFVCCMGLLDLYKPYLGHLQQKLYTTPGGILGTNLNQHIFSYFGTMGATIIFLMLYFISFLYLTNFRLGDWLRGQWARQAGGAGGGSGGPMTEEERVLEKRARELEKQARKLQEQADKEGAAGIGADLKPVPEPTVRDLSVPQNKTVPGRAKKPAAAEPSKEPAPPDEAVV